MKRGILLALPRFLLAACVAAWVLSHQKEESTVGDQMIPDQSFLNLVALIVVVAIVGGGSMAQACLQKQRAVITIFADVAVWSLIAGAFYLLLIR